MHRFHAPKMYGAVTVGERGQIVIPAQARKLFQIKAGDKLIVFAKSGGPIGLVPAGNFAHFLDESIAMMAKMKDQALK